MYVNEVLRRRPSSISHDQPMQLLQDFKYVLVCATREAFRFYLSEHTRAVWNVELQTLPLRIYALAKLDYIKFKKFR